MEAKDWVTLVFSIINLLAIIIIPIIAVVIGQRLQIKAKKREDKLQIFKILMTSRMRAWSLESVQALNLIDIVFADDQDVRTAWKDLHDKYCIGNAGAAELKKIETAQHKLLETMAKSLGYADQITWETIQNPYIPDGMLIQQQTQMQYQSNLMALLEMLLKNPPIKTDLPVTDTGKKDENIKQKAAKGKNKER